jgi:hypothetical protein
MFLFLCSSVRARLLDLLLKISEKSNDGSAPAKPSVRSCSVQCNLPAADDVVKSGNGSRKMEPAEKRKVEVPEKVREDAATQTDLVMVEVGTSRKSSISSLDSCDSNLSGWSCVVLLTRACLHK